MPLEATYQQSWEGVPQRWRRVIEVATSLDAAAEFDLGSSSHRSSCDMKYRIMLTASLVASVET